jgi:hypothetical protein
MNLSDTRREQRFKTDVSIKIKNMNASSYYNGKLTSLSKSGGCVEGKFSWKIGTPVEIIAVLQTDRTKYHTISAHVIWIEEDKIGVKFLFAP